MFLTFPRMTTQEERRRARVEQVFQRLDIDGSGGIDASELEQALVLMGVESSESVVSFCPLARTEAT